MDFLSKFVGHFDFVSQNCVLLPNWRQKQIPCGRMIQKSVLIHIYSFYVSKVIFSLAWAAILDLRF